MSAPRPDVTPPQPWTFPAPAEHLLGNGVRVLAHDLPGQYVLSLRVVVPTALSDEPPGKEGIGAMTARLLDEGTAAHGSEEFAELMERHGMVLGAGVSDGGLPVDVADEAARIATDTMDGLAGGVGSGVPGPRRASAPPCGVSVTSTSRSAL